MIRGKINFKTTPRAVIPITIYSNSVKLTEVLNDIPEIQNQISEIYKKLRKTTNKNPEISVFFEDSSLVFAFLL